MASETELDYNHHGVNVQVTSRLAERLKTYDPRKLGSFKKISKMFGIKGKYPLGYLK